MTSKSRHNVKNTSKVRNKVKIRHDIKKFVIKSKIRDDVMTSKTCHDIKKFVITSQNVFNIFSSRNNEKLQSERHLIKKLVIGSKSVSGCQQNASCCQNIPGVKMIFVTSISETYVITSSSLSHEKFVITSLARHDVKKFVMMSKSSS